MLKVRNKVRLRRFISQHFSYLVMMFYDFKFRILKLKKPPLVVLTVGKVGSSSVYYTLKKNALGKVFHVHNLNIENISKSKERHLKSDRNSIPLHLIISKLLAQKLNDYRGKVYIVTIVREPISRAISAFFQNTEFYKDMIETKGLAIDHNKALEVLNELFSRNICDELDDWFDCEIKGSFGIDVFKYPFDQEANYSIFRNGRYNLLLLRLETMGEVFPEAISKLLSLNSSFPLENHNIGGRKHYAYTYASVKEEFKVKEEILDEIVASRYFQHFYKGWEWKIKKKWGRGKQVIGGNGERGRATLSA